MIEIDVWAFIAYVSASFVFGACFGMMAICLMGYMKEDEEDENRRHVD